MLIDDFDSKLKVDMCSVQRSAKKNYDGLIDYINYLFSRHSKLLVLRVDFGYHKGNTVTNESDACDKYYEAKNDREHFFNNMKCNSIFEHLVGYAWKLEYGIDKGYHYHMVFFYDGNKVRQDESIAMLIGEYWKNTITSGRGIYFNCNANKGNYSNVGVGMMNYYDAELRNNLTQTVYYLTKVDNYVRALMPDNGRTFGRGEISKIRSINTGRPRKYD